MGAIFDSGFSLEEQTKKVVSSRNEPFTANGYTVRFGGKGCLRSSQ